MPRDGSGNYTLPLGNPVVDGTVIETSWANPTMADIANQLNNVLTRDGLLGPTLPFKLVDGTAGSPGLSFAAAPSTGMYRESDRISFSYNGARIMGILADKVIFDEVPQFAGAPVDPEDLANKAYVDATLAGGVVPGTVPLNAVDIAGNRAFAAADFGTGLLRVNAAGVVAITVPTVAVMGLAATPGKIRVIAFIIFGAGIPTFAGATAATTINGTAGATTVLPVGGAPKQYQIVVLTQTAVGADAWSLA
jgi:hypothetical protein